jgi:hypothetical protein
LRILAAERSFALSLFISLTRKVPARQCWQSARFPVHGLVDTEGAPKDKAEIAKELLTAVIEARSYTLLDNCKGHLTQRNSKLL